MLLSEFETSLFLSSRIQGMIAATSDIYEELK